MKTAILGVWHVHTEDYLKTAMKYGEVVGVYDENESKRKEFCEKWGLKEFECLEELLQSSAEGVIVCSSTNLHTNYIIKAAQAKKHIFTEKVLTINPEDSQKIKEEIENNKVNFVISMVKKYNAPVRTVKKITDSGELGKINYFRYRNCHGGSIDGWLPAHFYSKEQCGGGAMMDLGAHGMYLAYWFLGMPEIFSSAFTIACENPKNKDNVEDNAVTMMSYTDGAIALNETGFVSKCCPAVLEIGGENGYVKMVDNKVMKATLKTQEEWVDVPLEEELPSPLVQFLTNKADGDCGIDDAVALTVMMDKAYNKIM